MESGSGNPSLTNLVKLASALSIGIEALLARPRNQCELVLAKDIPLQEKSKGKALMYKLLPDKIKGIEIDRIELEALSTMGGQPHLSGTKEYLTVIKGEITMYISGEIYSVKKGDVLAFPGNQAHSYRNNKNTSAIALSVVVPVPSSL